MQKQVATLVIVSYLATMLPLPVHSQWGTPYPGGAPMVDPMGYYGSGQSMMNQPCGFGPQMWPGLLSEDDRDEVPAVLRDKFKKARKAEKEVEDIEGKIKRLQKKIDKAIAAVNNTLDDNAQEDGDSKFDEFKDCFIGKVSETDRWGYRPKYDALGWRIKYPKMQYTSLFYETGPGAKDMSSRYPAGGGVDRIPPPAVQEEPRSDRTAAPGAEPGTVQNPGEPPAAVPDTTRVEVDTQQTIIFADTDTGCKNYADWCVRNADKNESGQLIRGKYKSCIARLKELFGLTREYVRLQGELELAQEKLEEANSALEQAQTDYEDGNLDADIAGCDECEKERKAKRGEQMLGWANLIAGIGGMVGAGFLEYNRVKKNANIGYPSGPGLSPIMAGLGAGFINQGLYGAYYGGVGAGAFGCAPGYTPFAGPYGAAGLYGAFGFPYGGGMYMPGYGPYGMPGPWGVGMPPWGMMGGAAFGGAIGGMMGGPPGMMIGGAIGMFMGGPPGMMYGGVPGLMMGGMPGMGGMMGMNGMMGMMGGMPGMGGMGMMGGMPGMMGMMGGMPGMMGMMGGMPGMGGMMGMDWQLQYMQQQMQMFADLSKRMQVYTSTMTQAMQLQQQAYQILYGGGRGYGMSGGYGMAGGGYLGVPTQFPGQMGGQYGGQMPGTQFGGGPPPNF